MHNPLLNNNCENSKKQINKRTTNKNLIRIPHQKNPDEHDELNTNTEYENNGNPKRWN